ncbi:hypothetical protein O181_118668 [Austropuccinia psidii MF-1]|uniref:Uncharacterized protein n=1 Tax=Austropuccinia psidii MF-1 TaxID=1389203 RepID=A0A9Q3KCF9_9BASI|nr:hypothetical protein [Austropuccinia psidii MF-1]
MPTLPSRCDSDTAPHLRPHHSLCSSSALKIYLLCGPQPSLFLILSAYYHPYALAVSSGQASNAAPTPPTILMLLQCSQDKTTILPPHLRPHHSLHFCTPASSSLPLTILALLRFPQPSSCLLPPTNYNPYALAVSS